MSSGAEPRRGGASGDAGGSGGASSSGSKRARSLPTAAAHLLPYTVGDDGAVLLMLGYRRTGEAAARWTEIATAYDTACMPSTTRVTPSDGAARAGHAALMGLLGTAAQINLALAARGTRVPLPDGAYAYLLHVLPQHADVVEQYNNVARFLAGAYIHDKRDGGTHLLHCPPAVLPFTQVQWLPLAKLRTRLSAARAPDDGLHVTLAPATIHVLRHVVPTLDVLHPPSVPPPAP